MSCYHPLLRVPRLKNLDSVDTDKNGEIQYTIRGMSHGEYDLYHSGDMSWILPGVQLIPCGHCVGCKLDYSRTWADRMLLELQSAHGKAVYVTLTYAPESIPLGTYMDNNNVCHTSYTLFKPDLQAFIKNLRARYSGNGDFPNFPVRRIRFYGAGEYGEFTLRPHYHVILFGIDLDDIKATPSITPLGDPILNHMGDPYYNSPVLEDVWTRTLKARLVKSVDPRVNDFVSGGLVSIGAVSWRSCAYVARYVTKKWSSGFSDVKQFKHTVRIPASVEWNESHDGRVQIIDIPERVIVEDCDSYTFFGVEPEFSLMSRMPGIGGLFLEEWNAAHPGQDIIDYDKVSAADQSGGKSVKVPKYFRRKYKDSPDIADYIKYSALVNRLGLVAEARTALELSKTDLEYIDYLAVKENNHLKAIKVLSREKV